MSTITVQQAEIRTATVEIKTLTISKKQVTLAVFRQIPVAGLIAPDGTLNGVPWGTVNYHPKCMTPKDHWHIVWQSGTELRHSVVYKDPGFDYWRPKSGGRFLTSCIRDSLKEGTPYFGGSPPVPERDTWVTLKGEDLPVQLFPAAAAVKAVRAAEARDDMQNRYGDHTEDWAKRMVSEARSRADEALAELDAACESYNATTGELFAAYRISMSVEIARRERHHQVREALAELPQLFIAV